MAHFSRQFSFWSLRCSWSIACQHCSNYIFILHFTLSFSILHKDNCKRRQETFQFGDLEHLLLQILQYMFFSDSAWKGFIPLFVGDCVHTDPKWWEQWRGWPGCHVDWPTRREGQHRDQHRLQQTGKPTLTHWPLEDVAVILNQSFSNSYQGQISWALPSGGCRWTSLMISQYWFRWWLGAIRQQAIDWANVDLDQCCRMTSQDSGS